MRRFPRPHMLRKQHSPFPPKRTNRMSLLTDGQTAATREFGWSRQANSSFVRRHRRDHQRALALARLALLTEPANRQSQRVAERNGFQSEGVLRSYTEIDERRVDNVSFSLLPSDLEQDS